MHEKDFPQKASFKFVLEHNLCANFLFHSLELLSLARLFSRVETKAKNAVAHQKYVVECFILNFLKFSFRPAISINTSFPTLPAAADFH